MSALDVLAQAAASPADGKCCAYHKEWSLSPAVLAAMCLGSDKEIDLTAVPFCNHPKKSQLRLTRAVLMREAKRRIDEYDIDSARKPNSNANIQLLTDFLKSHPVPETVDLLYLASAVEELKSNIEIDVIQWNAVVICTLGG